MTQSMIKPQRKPAPAISAPSAAPARPARQPSHEEISKRARALWEGKGRPTGQDDAIWLEAEAELKKG